MLIPVEYIKFLEDSGVPLNNIGVREIGLTRKNARHAIDLLGESPVAVLGGDVLSLKNGSPQYTGDNWSSDRLPQEEVGEYAVRSKQKARDFLQKYPDPEDGTILYTLVIAEYGIPGTAYR